MENETKQKSGLGTFLIDTLKGFIIGAANVIPGASGGTLALVIGIYEKLIGALSNIASDLKNSLKTLAPILLGVAIAFLTLSHVITFCLDKFLFATIMLFFGAVLGGMPMLSGKVKGKKVKPAYIAVAVATFAVVIGLVFLGTGTDVDISTFSIGKILLLFVAGAVAAATMVIPGVSGSAFLMTIGLYEPVMNQVKALTSSDGDKGHALIVILIVAVGIIVGIVGIAKLIDMLLKNYETGTYWAIIGFVLSSAIVILLQNFFLGAGVAANLAGTSVLEYIAGVVLAVLGFLGAYKLGDK
ncbi:MAG: DUF368 domain-containing protein [Clostridia bacterium]|nr:DUF368 domain-containing protein [Clostridia bacterium]